MTNSQYIVIYLNKKQTNKTHLNDVKNNDAYWMNKQLFLYFIYFFPEPKM